MASPFSTMLIFFKDKGGGVASRRAMYWERLRVAPAHRQPAESELLHHLGDALDSETAVDGRVLVFVLIGQTLKMLFEQKLEGIDPARVVHPLGDRSELKG